MFLISPFGVRQLAAAFSPTLTAQGQLAALGHDLSFPEGLLAMQAAFVATTNWVFPFVAGLMELARASVDTGTSKLAPPEIRAKKAGASSRTPRSFPHDAGKTHC